VSQAPAAVGALQVTCSDESESECVEAFQRGFVQYMLPPLKFARHAPFRVASLGGRYEWGAASLAEQHFSYAPADRGFSLFVAKINAHVACEDLPSPAEPFRLGVWRRYGIDSPCCGALDGLLRGATGPGLDDLREAFASEGMDRLGALRDETAVPPLHRALAAAIASARLQARKVVLELQDRPTAAPVWWLILPAVTLNRHEQDHEILCGIYSVGGKDGGRGVLYEGLGDDPAGYRVERSKGRFVIADDHLGRVRPGRDHRRMAHQQFQLRRGGHPLVLDDERLERVVRDVRRNRHRDHHHARTLLRIALPVLAEIAPVPMALLAFAQGAAGVHHAFRIHRIAGEMEGTEEARRLLDEIHDRIDQMEGERAEALLDLLVEEYSRSPV
jgi:hypothetical protein